MPRRLEFSLIFHDPQHAFISGMMLPLSAILRSYSRQLRENPAIRRLGALCPWCLHEECQSLLPEKVMASGKNGDDGDLLLFRDGPGACDISTGTLRFLENWESRVFLEWDVPWRLPVSRSCPVTLRSAILITGLIIWRESWQFPCTRMIQMRDPYDMLFQDGE
ncbi:hypothetical protein Tco_0359272 [Tanacetum coccineum]